MQQTLKFLIMVVLFGLFVSVGLTYRLSQERVSLQLEQTTPLAGTFSGDLPCADCAFLRLTLTLNPTGPYTLISQYAEKGSFTDTGFWQQQGNTLTLSDMNQPFLILNNNTLEMVGSDGKPAQSGLNYKLIRQPISQ